MNTNTTFTIKQTSNNAEVAQKSLSCFSCSCSLLVLFHFSSWYIWLHLIRRLHNIKHMKIYPQFFQNHGDVHSRIVALEAELWANNWMNCIIRCKTAASALLVKEEVHPLCTRQSDSVTSSKCLLVMLSESLWGWRLQHWKWKKKVWGRRFRKKKLVRAVLLLHLR